MVQPPNVPKDVRFLCSRVFWIIQKHFFFFSFGRVALICHSLIEIAADAHLHFMLIGWNLNRHGAWEFPRWVVKRKKQREVRQSRIYPCYIERAPFGQQQQIAKRRMRKSITVGVVSDHQPIGLAFTCKTLTADLCKGLKKEKKTLEMIHHCRLVKKERARIYGTLARWCHLLCAL